MKVKTWGVICHQEIPHSTDNRCPECGDKTLGVSNLSNTAKPHIVGFEDGSMKAIFRCPGCDCLFWFHFMKDFVEDFFENFEER